MLFNKVILSKIQYFEPTLYKTSDDLEFDLIDVYQKLKLPAGRMELQSGIKRRGFFPRETKPSLIAAKSAESIVNHYGTDAFDMLIYAGVCRDMLEPSTASFVANYLNLSEKTQSFDLSNACLGMMNALYLTSSLIEAGQIQRALIVTGENSGPLLLDTIEFLKNDPTITRESIKKYVANFTIGSAGVAFVVEKYQPQLHGLLIQSMTNLVDTTQAHLCQGGGDTKNLMMETNSEELLLKGMILAEKNYKNLITDWKQIPDKMITHQVGSAHQFKLYETIKEDIKKDYSTFSLFGNTGSAAWALTYARALESHFINPKDNVAVLGIGSGIHCSMLGGQLI